MLIPQAREKHPRSFTEKTTAETLRCAQGDRPSPVSLSSVTQLAAARAANLFVVQDCCILKEHAKRFVAEDI
jgi:hypothetical protein